MSEERDGLEALGSDLRAAFDADDTEALQGTITPEVLWHVVAEDGSDQQRFDGETDLVAGFDSLVRSDSVILLAVVQGDLLGEVWQFPDERALQQFLATGGSGGGPPPGGMPLAPAVVRVIDSAYGALEPWVESALRATLTAGVVWHATDGGTTTNYSPIDAVVEYLNWPDRKMKYGGATLSITSRTLAAQADGRYVATHVFTVGSTSRNIRLVIRLDGTPPKIAEVWQTFDAF